MKRIILASDIHDCNGDWYGMKNRDRMECFVRDMNAEYEKNPYDLILFLGDYSLDHWIYGGSWLSEGVSNTADFVKTVASRMPAPYYMLAGNHEQYGDARWLEITGFHRQFSVEWEGILFLMLDTYAADLDPSGNSDGTYTGIDVSYVRAEMEAHPGLPVILCAHHFEQGDIRPEEAELLRDPRVVCLFGGHVHESDLIVLPPECGSKTIIRTGNYSYSSCEPPKDSVWGFRELLLFREEEGNGNPARIVTRYITPANTYSFDGAEFVKSYGKQDGATLFI